MACICAPVIDAEMHDWVALGGANSGCCGNEAHKYGFHREATAIPSTDYSRRRDPAGPNAPYNWNYACAGDFSHGGKAHLRDRHAVLLARLMAGDPKLWMICEFIGKPWADKPVYYWAPWNGVGTLNRYTGAGHDTWSHISWYRSRANQRAYLWTPGPTPEHVTTYPAYPGYVIAYNPDRYDSNLKVWQIQMRKRGWRIVVDGVYGPDTRRVVLAFQADKHLERDGEIGPITWATAWTAAVT